MPFCSASPRSSAPAASTGGTRTGWRSRAPTTRASVGNRRPRRSSHSFSSSEPAPAPKHKESHSPESNSAASSAGSMARSAPVSSPSTSAPRLTSRSRAQSTMPVTTPRHLYLEIVGEEGFVQFLNLDMVLLGIQKAAGQFLERLCHVARLAPGDPEIHHDLGEVAGVVEGSEDRVHFADYQLEHVDLVVKHSQNLLFDAARLAEIEHEDIVVLADAMDAADPLFDAHRSEERR